MIRLLLVIVMKKKIIFIAIILIAILGVLFLIFKKDNNSKYLINLSANELKEKIDNKDSFILLISRTGCSHCAEYLPVFTKVLDDNKVTAYDVDLADFSKEERSYLNDIANVSGTPTTIFIEKGEEKSTINRIVGTASRKDITDRLKTMNYIK